MNRVSVCITSVDRRVDFIDYLVESGYPHEEVEGLPRHFVVEAVDLSSLGNHPLVLSIDDADFVARSPDAQAITLDAMLEAGSWAIPRTIRRSAPWLVDRLEHPIQTRYVAARDGTGVDLYVVDSGIAVSHPEFTGRATNVYEYIPSGGLGDDNGHGTLVASAAAGATVGFARGSTIFSFRASVIPGENSTSVQSFTAAVGQLITHYQGRANLGRPAVANLSVNPVLGGTAVQAINDLIDAGVVCILSAGNDIQQLSQGTRPLAFAEDLIVVGGANMADLPYWAGSDGTNFGDRLDIMAPGLATKIASAPVRNAGLYETRRGTSISCPFVSGVVACMLQGHPRLTSRNQVRAVREKLLENATTGKMRTGFGITQIPDRILYMDPEVVAPESIPGI